MTPKLPEPSDEAQAGQSLAASALFGERCLVCNGLGGHEEGCRGTSAYDELRESILQLRIEVNCRIEHGAESGGHLEYVQSKLDAMLLQNTAVCGPKPSAGLGTQDGLVGGTIKGEQNDNG